MTEGTSKTPRTTSTRTRQIVAAALGLELLVVALFAFGVGQHEVELATGLSDKFLHFSAFAVGALLACLLWPLQFVLPVAIATGVGIELVQLFLPWHDANLTDLAFSCAGASAGILLYGLGVRFRPAG